MSFSQVCSPFVFPRARPYKNCIKIRPLLSCVYRLLPQLGYRPLRIDWAIRKDDFEDAEDLLKASRVDFIRLKGFPDFLAPDENPRVESLVQVLVKVGTLVLVQIVFLVFFTV